MAGIKSFLFIPKVLTPLHKAPNTISQAKNKQTANGIFKPFKFSMPSDICKTLSLKK